MADGYGIEDGTPEERRRLPLLIEVLSRRTLAPVDLFSFYIYMRDQQRSVDYLDFWLDVSQHMSLCRHYVRELRRSVLYETPELDKAGSKRSSALLNDFDAVEKASMNGNGNGKGSFQSERSQDQRVSAVLRSESGDDSRSNKHSVQKSSESNNGDDESRSRSRSRSGTTSTRGTNTTHSQRYPRQSFMSSKKFDSSSPATHDESPQHTVNRADIRASAEKILYTFLLPGSEREIILPQAVLSAITEAIEEHGRDDPEVFDDAKEYVFLAMERDAFPGFLRSKALGNLVPPSLMVRLIVGLLGLFGAFWTAFILIFLDDSRSTRCWTILPFTVGIYALAAHQYTLDPALALAGYSEYTFCNFQKMREPFVKQLLTKRALMVTAWIVLIDVALVCLFVFVPGKRL